MFPLIQGLREINLQVWNSNSVSADSYIGSGKIFLEKVLSTGYDDSSWPLSSQKSKRSGEVHVVMHYSKPPSEAPSVAAPYNASFHAPPYTAPVYQAPPTYPHGAPAGQTGYPPVYQPYPSGHAPYAGPSTYGPGGYPPNGSNPPPSYPNAYPPQPGYGPPSGYPPYSGGGGYH